MINLEVLLDDYFAFDKTVEYKLQSGKVLLIKPYTIEQRKEFYAILHMFKADKRDNSDTEEKSELQFLIENMLKDSSNIIILQVLLRNLEYDNPFYGCVNDHWIIGNCTIKDDKLEIDKSSIIIDDEWEDIKRIILYQNNPDYDDSFYLDETIRKNIEIEKEIRNKGTTAPNLERLFYIIYAHTGITRDELLKLTLRGFTILFNEVIGEAEFLASYALRQRYAEKGKPADHWIWLRKKTGLASFATEAKGFLKGLGMDDNEILKEAYKEKVEFKNEVSEDEIEQLRRKIAAGEM